MGLLQIILLGSALTLHTVAATLLTEGESLPISIKARAYGDDLPG